MTNDDEEDFQEVKMHMSPRDRTLVIAAFLIVSIFSSVGVWSAEQAADDAHDAILAIEDQQHSAEIERKEACIRGRKDARSAVLQSFRALIPFSDQPQAEEIVDEIQRTLERELPDDFCEEVNKKIIQTEEEG